MDKFISHFGLPQQIHTDQGTSIWINTFPRSMPFGGKDKTGTTALHPQCDGLLEHFDKTLEDMTSKYIIVGQRSFFFAVVLMAY